LKHVLMEWAREFPSADNLFRRRIIIFYWRRKFRCHFQNNSIFFKGDENSSPVLKFGDGHAFPSRTLTFFEYNFSVACSVIDFIVA